jgi:hypothetical protein
MIIRLTKVACSIKDDLLIFKTLEQGIQEAQLNIEGLYPDPEERKRFEFKLHQFLKSDCYNSKIISKKNGLLVYQTECIMPEKKNSKRPLLLLLGNPASHSVYSKMFFSFENNERKGQREHRFWKALKESGILSFKSSSNLERKKELYTLDYDSPFRIGLATFYSMPSGSSGSEWSGVESLRKLFGTRALKEIAKYEKTRVNGLIHRFLYPENGVIFAFQKDAYTAIKSAKSLDYDYDKVRKERLEGVCQSDPSVRLFCFPPTRFMNAKKTIASLGRLKENLS